jgi:predicted RNase H-like nuclease
MFVGVDGCKKGWVKVGLTEGEKWEVELSPDINSLWNDSKQSLH